MNSQADSAGFPTPIFQSSTEAFLGDSDTPIPVRVGQLEEGVPTLTREEFKKASLRQRQLDAETEAQSKNPDPPPFTPPPSAQSGKIQPGRKPKAPSVVRRNGKPYLVQPTTLPLVHKVQHTEFGPVPVVDKVATQQAELEARIAKMEAGQAQLSRGVDKLVELLAMRDAAQESSRETREERKEVGDAAPLASMADPHPDDIQEEAAIHADDLEPDDDDVDLGTQLDPFEPGDTNIARMQQFIHRKTPLKDFRRFWQSLCPRAGFQEWPLVMQERFTELFGTIILHPKFLAQVYRTIRTFRNGQCAGEEQVYKMLVMLAGNCALYSIITTEQ